MTLVWYVAYGSNLSARRFAYYLAGGRPPGAALTYPGARDGTPPRDDRALRIPGAVYFATESPAWGGGRAFYDPDAAGTVAARAYLITSEQFSDVAAQEMYRDPGTDLDLAALATRGRMRIGNGRYETLVHVGTRDHAEMITFTAPWGMGDMPPSSPSAAYLRMLGAGLCEAHGWDRREAAGYLAGLRGAHGRWSSEEIAALLDQCGDGSARPR